MRALLLTCIASAVILHADTLQLRNGREVRGTFISGNSQAIRFLPDGGRATNYTINQVDRVIFGDSSSTTSRNDRDGNDRYRTRNDRDNYRNDSYRNDHYDSSRARTADTEIPSGRTISVRMIDSINSDSTDVGRQYRASLDQDLTEDGRVIAARGSDATVEVVRVDQARAIAGREQIGLSLTEITANGRRLRPVTEGAQISADSRGSQNVKVIGGTAALGAIIGAIAGGGTGAAIGAATGGAAGAAVQAVRGQHIEVPSETQLNFTLSQPLRF